MTQDGDMENLSAYEDPENVRGGRHLEARRARGLSGHVPVRFQEDVILQVKALAQKDGVTVSTWIRQLVMQELERRTRPTSEAAWYNATWVEYDVSAKSATTPDLATTAIG